MLKAMEHFEKTISSQRIHEGRIINLREDTVALPSGRSAKREIVEHQGAVCVVPVLNDGRIVMVRQFRKPAEDALLEIPAGGLNPNEDPMDCARRELIEECGLHGGELTPLFTSYLAPGYSTEKIYGYLALGLREETAQADEDEFVEVVPLSLDAALAAIATGDIEDAKTIAGLTLAARLLPTL